MQDHSLLLIKIESSNPAEGGEERASLKRCVNEARRPVRLTRPSPRIQPELACTLHPVASGLATPDSPLVRWRFCY